MSNSLLLSGMEAGGQKRALALSGNQPSNDSDFQSATECEGQETTAQRVKVRAIMFARARELAGISEVDLMMNEGSTTLECVAELSAKFPSLAAIRDCMVVALNYNYVSDPVKVKDGDELAIIPPISGG